MYMTVKEEKETPKNPSTLTLIAFKPRQVILAEKKQTLSSSSSTNPTLMALVEQKQSKTLTAEDKTQLLHSILHYLQSNQFSKSLKYLLKDAQIQDDSWKASNLDLEDIYSKYLENSKPVEMKSDKLEQLEDVTPAQETVSKKNKKKTDEKVTEPLVCDSGVEKSTTKPKKNKKNKITSEDAKQTEEKLKVDDGEIDNNETAKSKNKKKKNKSSAEPVVVEDEKLSNDDITLEESEVKPKEKKKKKEEKVKNENNDSKKRKRLASSENENENQPIEEESVTGETKRRKIEETNGVEKSNKKKQQNGSVEPKTINPFQRVKVDEVEVDERLQDNSYWAKDGADIGYGAKAQEILGQVRGKDFRHEKTKKKRGSYRGGQIDLQSHSVKFNYSDEE